LLSRLEIIEVHFKLKMVKMSGINRCLRESCIHKMERAKIMVKGPKYELKVNNI